MKVLKSLLMATIMATPCFVSCEEADSSMVSQQAEKQPETEKLAEALKALVESNDSKYADGGYIVYVAKTKEILTLSCEAYALGVIIAGDTTSGEAETKSAKHAAHKVPKEKGWIYAGKCSGKTIALVNKVSEKTGSDKDFVLRVERNSNESGSVWYRII